MQGAEAIASALPSLLADHRLLCAAIREAGGAVLDRFRLANARSWAKADASPVSEADIEANDILRARLLSGTRAGYGWLSEESVDDLHRLRAARTWVIDPIDGTRAFLHGRPEFTVCGALVEGEALVAAAIYNPCTDEMFEATLGGGARCNGVRLQAAGCEAIENCHILAWDGLFGLDEWPEPWPRMNIGYRNSTSYRMALVARGDVDAAIALVPKADWDVAMGALVASEAGAVASDHHGGAYRFNQPKPVQRALVCAGPRLYPHLIDRLRHLPSALRAGQRPHHPG